MNQRLTQMLLPNINRLLTPGLAKEFCELYIDSQYKPMISQPNLMKLACLTRIKNECDIIERFIRINSLIFDEFFIVDDASEDNTLEILSHLKEEGFKLNIYPMTDLKSRVMYLQSEVMNQLLHHASTSTSEGYDYYFCLDADEVIFSQREKILKELQLCDKSTYPKMRWMTFVPKHKPFSQTALLKESFLPLKAEPEEAFKAIMPREMVKTHYISNGHHRIYSNFRPDDEAKNQEINVPLCHFPIRSSNQIISKVLVTTHKVDLKETKGHQMSEHVYRMRKVIRACNYEIKSKTLELMAANYVGLQSSDAEYKTLDAFKDFNEMLPQYEQKPLLAIGALDMLLEEVIKYTIQK